MSQLLKSVNKIISKPLESLTKNRKWAPQVPQEKHKAPQYVQPLKVCNCKSWNFNNVSSVSAELILLLNYALIVLSFSQEAVSLKVVLLVNIVTSCLILNPSQEPRIFLEKQSWVAYPHYKFAH